MTARTDDLGRAVGRFCTQLKLEGYRVGRERPITRAECRTSTARCHHDDSGIDLHLVKPAGPGQLLWLLSRFRRIVAE